MARVVIVTNSLSGGGAERAMNILANELHRLNHEITVIAINSSTPDSITLTCNFIEVGRQWRGSLADTIKSLLKFKKHILRIKPDVVILNCDLPELYGAVISLGTKIIAVEHVNYPWRNRVLLGKLVRLILRIKKTTWVSVSDHLKVWPKNYSPARIIYNPISKIGDGEIRGSSPITRLVFMGRLTFQKNPELFIEIAHNVKLPALALGDGENRTALVELAKRLSVDLDAPGFRKFPWQEIGDGDLMIIPSRYEGDGLVVIEALQRNVPFIVSNIPEFKRFKLPKINYAANLEEYIEAITVNQDSTSVFQVNSIKAETILNERDVELIGDKWGKLIHEIMNRQER
jgi:glycosyltransferase involved in cell wall biosynthesis